jgi:hypothetical protein
MRLYTLADNGRKRIYSVSVSRLPAKPDETEAQDVLDRSRDGAVKLVAGTIKSETKERYGRHPGRSLTVALPSGAIVHARLVAADDRLYQVSIVSESERLSVEDRRVFDSLKIDPAGISDPRPQLPWRYVTPQGSTFAVEMPGDPREQAMSINTPLGKVDLRRLEVAAGSRTFFVQSCDMPNVGSATIAERLDAAREHVLRETGGKLVANSPVTRAGSEGRAIAVAFGGRTMVMQTFIDGPRVYQIGIVGTGEPTDDDRRFFESLRLSERE